MADEELDPLLAEQRAYYRARAGEYDATYPLDERADADARRRLLTELEAHAPYGRVLELACGTGQWTVELARNASAVTAIDSSPEALAICRTRVPQASYEHADLFAWRPEERYDLVFFAAWLSHVPPQRFEAFWALVADCLAPGGRVFVIDELPAVADVERSAPDQPAHVVERRLTTGESYRAVKVAYEPDDLRERLAALGWEAEVTTVGWRFFCATVRRAGPAIERMAPDTPQAARALRSYYADAVSTYHGRAASDAEVDAAMREEPSDDLVLPHGLLLVAHRHGGVLGCAGLRVLADGIGELTRVFVVPDARRRGLGSRLLRELEQEARSLGVRVLRLDTRSDLVEARRLYSRHGYLEVAPFNDEPYAEHWFAKHLTSHH